MRAPKETPPAATEGAEENHIEPVELNAEWHPAHEEKRSIENPAGLRRPPGLVGDIADYIFNSSQRPMLEAAVLAALGLVAGIAGRCYNISGDGLNLYMLLLAPTGRGKSAMAKGIDRLVTEVRMPAAGSLGVSMVDDFIGPAEFASGPALHNAVSESPSMICLFGEFGLKLKAMSGARANDHEVAQLRLLLDLYNKSGRFDELRERRYAGRDKSTKAVRSPAVTILGESTPENIYENLSHDLVRNGLLPRFIVAECLSDRPARNRNAGAAPPESVVARLRDLVAIASQARTGPNYCDVHMDDAAAEILDSIDADLDGTYSDANPVERELWNRALQNINRVAALLAVGMNPHNPVITEDCAKWAVEFVYASVENLVAKFEEGLVGGGDSRQEAEVKRFLRDYLQTSENERHFGSYRVPRDLAHDRTAVGLDYLRRRARQVRAFTTDRRGYRVAVDSALKGLVDTGLLFEIKPHDAQRAYGIRSVVYRIYRDDLLN